MWKNLVGLGVRLCKKMKKFTFKNLEIIRATMPRDSQNWQDQKGVRTYKI